jgi:hypothetical protein
LERRVAVDERARDPQARGWPDLPLPDVDLDVKV